LTNEFPCCIFASNIRQQNMKTTNTLKTLAALLFAILTNTLSLWGQSYPTSKTNEMEPLLRDYEKISAFFEEAYQEHPSIPRGILEAISYQYRRFHPEELYYEDDNTAHSIPHTHTVMGLTLDGKGVFRENLRLVDSLSSFSQEEILNDNRKAILAYAEAFASLQRRSQCFSKKIEDYKNILITLSELPYQENPENWEENYPINSFLYETYRFLSDSDMVQFSNKIWNVDFDKLFGEDLYRLRQGHIDLKGKGTTTNSDYSGANWLAAASCNYTQGRNGTAITGVAIHYTQGTYAGALAWFRNCNANASAHYIIRSSDGQITQMVREQDKAWHVGSANGYTIGIEHEAYGDIASFFTEVMYQTSADLVRDICLRHPNISTQRSFYRDTLDDGTVLNSGLHSLGGSTACTQIRGHQHFPNQTHTDPGPFWNWNHYYHLLNNTDILIDTNTTGLFYDSGGPTDNYGANEHQLFLIKHTNADSITLDFSQFDLEANYDFLWIYDGDNLSAPCLGRWNTTSPGHIKSSGPALLIEFRSDCATQQSGWCAQWICHNSQTSPSDMTPPTTHILHDESIWVKDNFTLAFDDSDDTQIRHRLWQIMEYNNFGWQSNPKLGFLCDNFDSELDTSIWLPHGQWQITNHKLTCENGQNGQGNIYAHHHDANAECFLYDFYLTMTSGDSCSFFFHLSKDTQQNPWKGYEVRFEKNKHRISLYHINEGNPTLIGTSGTISINDNGSYLYRVLWDTTHQIISIFRQQTLLLSCATGSLDPSENETFIGFSSDKSIIIDNLRVYAGRTDSVMITVGSSDTCHMRAQAEGGIPMCKVKSIVIDDAFNFSDLAENAIKIDYTPPPTPTRVEAYVTTNNARRSNGIPIYGQWDSVVDEQSGLAGYEYSLYITTNLNTCLREDWTSSIWPNTAAGLQIPRQSISCKIGVRSLDNAGNRSRESFSNDLFNP